MSGRGDLSHLWAVVSNMQDDYSLDSLWTKAEDAIKRKKECGKNFSVEEVTVNKPNCFESDITK